MKKTTVVIFTKDASKLRKLRVYPRETYAETVSKLLKQTFKNNQ